MRADEKIDAVLSAQAHLDQVMEENALRQQEAMATLRDATQGALSSGAGATTLAKAAGVSRQRIYKWASKEYR